MPRGWTDNDPAKGTPDRRTREKIGLLLGGWPEQYGDGAYVALEQVVWRVAEKRPQDVLDALVWLVEEDGGPA